MDSSRQAAALLSGFAQPGETLLDAGCGSGYFFHSIASQGLNYCGVDAAPSLVEIGRQEMPAFGCPSKSLICARIEDLEGCVDHVVCLNVLSNLDNFHRPLDRLLFLARRTLILRESIWPAPSVYSYVRDEYLDPGVELYVHVNTYNAEEVIRLGNQRGFRGTSVIDERTQGRPESVIGHPHHWAFMIFEKKK